MEYEYYDFKKDFLKNGLFLIDFKWSILGPLILITIAD
jgi:hypothetical protein